ncbi:hypothetical protein B9Z55_004944 [Caenorhabditis nigoni]|uniref:Uncharacterized protein n=1 Tax=Caenorhabditis nigoni TaxID=1611254 RepID=A0A2G5UYP4_9PELO|nr:hypothetical protein B9Z55_004944 [Caenorhabditis nigoni]
MRTTSTAGDSSRYVSLGGAVGQILVDDVPQQTNSMASGSTASAKTSTTTTTNGSDIRRDQRGMSMHTNQINSSRDASQRTVSVAETSRFSEQTSSTLTSFKSAPPIPESEHHGESISQLVANSTVSAPVGGNDSTLRAGIHPADLKMMVAGRHQNNQVVNDPYRNAQRFVTNFLIANQASMPYVGAKRPKTDRMLDLVGDWLFSIVNSPSNSQRVTGNDPSGHGHYKKNNDGVSDEAKIEALEPEEDVIDKLKSLCTNSEVEDLLLLRILSFESSDDDPHRSTATTTPAGVVVERGAPSTEL